MQTGHDEKFLNIIAAIDKNYGLGFEGKLSWRVHTDMAHFKKATQKSVLIMGRKTWESIPIKARNFEGRLGVIILSSSSLPSSSSDEEGNGKGDGRSNKSSDFIQYAKTIKEAIARSWKRAVYLEERPSTFICGGREVYKAVFLDYMYLVKEIFITLIPGEYLTDVFFPFPSTLVRDFIDQFFIYPEIKTPLLLKITDDKILARDLETDGLEGIVRYLPNDILKFPHLNPSFPDLAYSNLIKRIIDCGEFRDDRTGIGTFSLFDQRIEFDLADGFPLLNRRPIFWRGIVEETFFFLHGETNTKKLEEKKVNIWKGNTSRDFLDGRGLQHLEEGDMGGTYGFLWRHFGAEYKGMDKDYTGMGFDQIKYVLKELKENPFGRRHIVSAWSPDKMDGYPLPSCHMLFQFYVRKDPFSRTCDNPMGLTLDCRMFQRSSDVMLGLPFNIASYSLITHLFSSLLNYHPGRISFLLGDTHIYKNHIEGANLYLRRISLPFPTLSIELEGKEDIDELDSSCVTLNNYFALTPIHMEMAV